MVFTSSLFLFVFFPLCLGGYWLTVGLQRAVPRLQRLRFPDWFLVAASLAFYGWTAVDGIGWLVGYILLIYLLGRVIVQVPGKTQAGLLAVLSSVLVVTLTLLYCKYYNFAVSSLNQLLSVGISTKSIVAPLGISFITFSAVSYFVDLYRRDRASGTLLDTALYLSFFPKVISGPIAQWKDFAPFANGNARRVDSERMLWGIDRILIGLGKKLILADVFGAQLAEMQRSFANGMDQPSAWGAALLYMLQIYYDFSGYSDLALGLSALFGIELKENFHFPYLSQSITEFWRRWHISLGSWFREYLYIPLGGNRKGRERTLLNLFLVFLVTGIWHGAGWNYILWGVINGLLIVGERCVREKEWYRKIPAVLKWAATMLAVLLSWQVFRLGSLSEISRFFGLMFGWVKDSQINFTWQYYFDLRIVVLMLIGIVGATCLGQSWAKALAQRFRRSKLLFCLEQMVLMGIGILAVMCMVNSTYSPFLYFQY